MQCCAEDNQIIFAIRPNGRVECTAIQSTSYEMQIDLNEIANATKKFVEDLLKKKFPKGFRS